MAIMGQVGLLMVLLTSFIYGTLAISGHATPYKGNVFPSACNNTKVDPGRFVAAVSTSMFQGGYRCGFKYHVRCSSDPKIRYPCAGAQEGISVTVVDACQLCQGFDLILSKEAFYKIAAPIAEEIFVDYALSSGVCPYVGE